MGHRLTTCHNREIAKFPIAPTKNPYFIVRGIARKGSNQARSVEVGLIGHVQQHTAQKLHEAACGVGNHSVGISHEPDQVAKRIAYRDTAFTLGMRELMLDQIWSRKNLIELTHAFFHNAEITSPLFLIIGDGFTLRHRFTWRAPNNVAQLVKFNKIICLTSQFVCNHRRVTANCRYY